MAFPRLRSLGLAGAALAATLLGGCAGDGGAGLLAGGGPGTTAATAGAATEAAGGLGVSTERQGGGFNPFAADGAPEDTPLREVIANPTLDEVLRPGPLPEYALGRAEAPVVVVKYMSLTCPHCRRFMADTFPAFKREYIDTGKVRLVIREFPIGKTSGNATIALRCAPMSQYLTLYKRFLEQQAVWVSQEVRPEAIMRVAAQVGMTREQYDACVKNQALVDGLRQVKDRGRTLGIIGTPNFFVGNRLVKTTVGLPELRALIDPLLKS